MRKPSLILPKLYFPIFLLVIFIGVTFRIYNLSWGSPHFFHPDERNIASSVSQLSYPDQMNPKFFAYGTLPIYSIYFLGVLKNVFFLNTPNIDLFKVNFEEAILIGRAISTILSIGVVYLIFRITETAVNKRSAFIASVLSLLSVGLIQYAHFMTFEMWLTFLTTLLLLFIIKYHSQSNSKNFLAVIVTLGVLVSVKISSLIFIPISLLIIFIIDIYKTKRHGKLNFLSIEKKILKIIFGILLVILIIAISSPFFFLDKQSFLSSINYEVGVATGKIPVFYTQGFIDSTPILYQLLRVYPFVLNPITLFVFLFTFPFLIFKSLKKLDFKLLFIIGFFLITFFSQAFLYVKWVRYYIPTLPFIYILIGIYLGRKNFKAQKIIILILFLVSLLYSFSFIKSNVLSSSSIEGSIWFARNVSNTQNPKAISEIYDMGIVPFNPYANITLFNFYELEPDPSKKLELNNLILNSDFIILPSQRILKDRIKKPDLFPEGNKFYSRLLNGSLGFSKIYETPCDIFCKILYSGSPIYSYETTANAFDRPQVTIFKKNK